MRLCGGLTELVGAGTRTCGLALPRYWGQVVRWTGGQVARWTGGQVARWPGGQVVRWSGGSSLQ